MNNESVFTCEGTINDGFKSVEQTTFQESNGFPMDSVPNYSMDVPTSSKCIANQSRVVPGPGGRSNSLLTQNDIMTIFDDPPKMGGAPTSSLNQSVGQWQSLCNGSQERPILPLADFQIESIPFPVEVLPDAARSFVLDVSIAFNVHAGVVATLLFSSLSISLRGRYKVERHKNHTELMTLYSLIIMPSGKMKTPLMETFLKPIKNIQRKIQEEFIEKKELIEIDRDLKLQEIKNLKRRVSKKGRSGDLIQQIVALRKKLPDKPVPPSLFTNTFTPAGLAKELAKQKGILSIVSSELGTLKSLNPKKDDILLHGWDGESYFYTKAEDSVKIENPCITVLLATQDKNAATMLSKADFQEDGLLGRFLCIRPPAIGPYSVSTTEVPKSSLGWFENLVSEILARTMKMDSQVLLPLSTESSDWNKFHHWTQDAASKNGMPALKSFYRKLAGTALRFAGFLHILHCYESEKPFSDPISFDHVKAGIQVAQFYEQHALAILDVEKNEVLELAQCILGYLKDLRKTEVTVREISRGKNKLRGGVHKLEAPLSLLEAHGYIVRFTHGNSKRIIVNPKFFLFL